MTVKISSVLYKELMQIKESGEVDESDVEASLKYAQEHALSAAVRAIQGNPGRYLKCVTDGMEVCG